MSATLEPTQFEEREVRVADPHLSADANTRLTEEVREVVGAERVRVPKDRAHPSQGDYPSSTTAGVFVVENRLVLGITLAALLVVAVFLTLITGDWWFLPLAVGVHAAATMAVLTMSMRLTTTRERPHPTTVALLEEEGIRDPEALFSDIVSEFTDADRRGAKDLTAEGAGRRTTWAGDDPIAAGAQQQTAMTPAASPSEPVDTESLPFVIAATLAIGIPMMSIIVAAIAGGWMWLMPAILVPCGIAWLALRQLATPLSDDVHEEARRIWTPRVVTIGTVVGVIVFSLLVALWMTI